MSHLQIALPTDPTAALPAIREHQAVEFCAEAGGEWLALAVDGLELAPFLHPGEQTWRWRWNPGAAVGTHQVALVRQAQASHWQLRVEPRKIDQEQYAALLADLQVVARSLAYNLGAASNEGAARIRQPGAALDLLESYYALVEGQFADFARAVERIGQRPRETLGQEVRRLPLGLTAGIDAAALAELARGHFDQAPPGVADSLQIALRPAGGLLPHDVATSHTLPGYDTYEHRLLKHTLGLLAQRIRTIGELATHAAARFAGGEAAGRAARIVQIAAGCTAATKQVRELQTLPFLAAVAALPAFHGATPLLQRDPHYRAIYRMWQALRQQPLLECDSPLFSIPISELPYLYEAWCALSVAHALLDSGGVVREQRLVRPPTPGAATLHTLGLADDQPLLVIERAHATLYLRYQPRYRPARPHVAAPSLSSLDRHTRVPDLALEIVRGNAPPQVLVFDAKYRLDEDGRGVPADALADAYAYLGAIGCSQERATIGALLLYPGTHDEHYPSGVGALALVPGRTKALGAYLGAALTDCGE